MIFSTTGPRQMRLISRNYDDFRYLTRRYRAENPRLHGRGVRAECEVHAPAIRIQAERGHPDNQVRLRTTVKCGTAGISRAGAAPAIPRTRRGLQVETVGERVPKIYQLTRSHQTL